MERIARALIKKLKVLQNEPPVDNKPKKKYNSKKTAKGAKKGEPETQRADENSQLVVKGK